MKSSHKTAGYLNRIPLRIKLLPFLNWGKLIDRNSLLSDLLAGLTGAFIVLPQGVSFAMIAGLPPEYGLYTAIVPTIIAALFGSSRHLVSGPTTAISIIVFSTLSPIAEPGSQNYILMAFTLTFLAGVFQLIFGLVRLGTLINFVSHSVIVGFTAGAAILIATGQLKHALGIHIPGGSSFITSWVIIFKSSSQINQYELTVAMITLLCAALLKTFRPKWPGLLMALILGSLVSIMINGDAHGVRFLGKLPGTLPPLSSPDFTLDTIRLLAPGALAIALLGLIEAISIARSITIFSEQHINANQEFIGQGLSNIIGGFFSAYASSGSFTRSGVNYDSGAITPLASIFSTLFLGTIIVLLAPLTAWLPLSAMGGVILVVAVKLIDLKHIKEILRSSPSDSMVLLATFCGTLFFQIEFAIYTGVMLSLSIYLTRTSHPSISVMVPDPEDPRRRLIEVLKNGIDVQDNTFSNRLDADIPKNTLSECPQLKIIRINGSLFFGAAGHVAEILEEIDKASLITNKTQQLEHSLKNLLIVGYGINFIDVSGAMMFSHEAQRRAKMGKTMYLCRVNKDVQHFLKQGGFIDKIGEEHIFPTEYCAISEIFTKLDMDLCRKCRFRIFMECHNLMLEI